MWLGSENNFATRRVAKRLKVLKREFQCQFVTQALELLTPLINSYKGSVVLHCMHRMEVDGSRNNGVWKVSARLAHIFWTWPCGLLQALPVQCHSMPFQDMSVENDMNSSWRNPRPMVLRQALSSVCLIAHAKPILSLRVDPLRTPHPIHPPPVPARLCAYQHKTWVH